MDWPCVKRWLWVEPVYWLSGPLRLNSYSIAPTLKSMSRFCFLVRLLLRLNWNFITLYYLQIDYLIEILKLELHLKYSRALVNIAAISNNFPLILSNHQWMAINHYIEREMVKFLSKNETFIKNPNDSSNPISLFTPIPSPARHYARNPSSRRTAALAST